jgi:hypothetical protein
VCSMAVVDGATPATSGRLMDLPGTCSFFDNSLERCRNRYIYAE